jgi:hypothetical protein
MSMVNPGNQAAVVLIAGVWVRLTLRPIAAASRARRVSTDRHVGHVPQASRSTSAGRLDWPQGCTALHQIHMESVEVDLTMRAISERTRPMVESFEWIIARLGTSTGDVLIVCVRGFAVGLQQPGGGATRWDDHRASTQ